MPNLPDNIEVVVINDGIISVDGDLFYRANIDSKYPYIYFNMVKVRFWEGYLIDWNEEYKIISIPRTIARLSKLWHYFDSTLCFLRKDKDFVDKLSTKCLGASFGDGPTYAVDASEVTSGKFPRAIISNSKIYIYDKETYKQYA